MQQKTKRSAGIFGAARQDAAEELWRAADAARCLGLSETVVNKGRLGEGACATLPFLRLGRAIRYSPATTRAWRDAQMTTGTAEAAKAEGRQ